MAVEEHFSAISRAIGNPNRIKILWLLCQTEHSVDQLTRKTDISFANVSQHLQSMKYNGIVENRKDRNRVIYRLADESVIDMLVAVQNVARIRFPVVDHQVYQNASGNKIETIHPEKAWELLRNDTAMVADARPAEEYNGGHIPGAVSIPADEADYKHIANLELKNPLIIYGRHAFCELPELLFPYLQYNELHPLRLEGGMPEWFYGGWPIAG